MSVRRAGRTTATIRRTTGSTRRPSRIRPGIGRLQPDPLARPPRAHPGRPRALRGQRERGVQLPPPRPRRGGLHRGVDGPPGACRRRRDEPVPVDDRGRWPTGCGRSRPWPTRRSRSPCPTRSGSGSSERRPIVVWQVDGRRFLVDADRVVFGEGGGPSDLPVVDRQARGARRPGRSDRQRRGGPAAQRPGSRRSATRSIRSTSTRRRGSARSARPTSAAAPRRSG